MMELVDMLGLEPSALRCAGSSPVPGRLAKSTLQRVIFCFFGNIYRDYSDFFLYRESVRNNK